MGSYYKRVQLLKLNNMNPYQKIARMKSQHKYDMIFGVQKYLKILKKQKMHLDLSTDEKLFLKEINEKNYYLN